MPFADHHDMVKAFPSNRSNHALGIGVLPGRAWRNDRFPDAQRPGLTRKSFSIDLVSVPDQIPLGDDVRHNLLDGPVAEPELSEPAPGEVPGRRAERLILTLGGAQERR